MIPICVYALCALIGIICMGMLFRGWLSTQSKLLLLSSICFAFLAVNNVILLVDYAVGPSVDLSLWRDGFALTGMGILIHGLIWSAGSNP